MSSRCCCGSRRCDRVDSPSSITKIGRPQPQPVWTGLSVVRRGRLLGFAEGKEQALRQGWAQVHSGRLGQTDCSIPNARSHSIAPQTRPTPRDALATLLGLVAPGRFRFARPHLRLLRPLHARIAHGQLARYTGLEENAKPVLRPQCCQRTAPRALAQAQRGPVLVWRTPQASVPSSARLDANALKATRRETRISPLASLPAAAPPGYAQIQARAGAGQSRGTRSAQGPPATRRCAVAIEVMSFTSRQVQRHGCQQRATQLLRSVVPSTSAATESNLRLLIPRGKVATERVQRTERQVREQDQGCYK